MNPDLPAAAKVACVITTRFIVVASPTSVRIIFGDQLQAEIPANFHSSVMLSAADARWLADLIPQQILEAEKLAQKNGPTAR